MTAVKIELELSFILKLTYLLMKTVGVIILSAFNSSGEGTVTYTVKSGHIVFEYGRWGETVSIPSPEEWDEKYKSSWAQLQREAIVQDLISQMVSDTRPNFEITKYGVLFFNAKQREQEKRDSVAASTASQAPALDHFISSFEIIPDIEKEQMAVWVMDIAIATAEHADCFISEVLHGSKNLVGGQLKLAFDPDVPMLSGRKYNA